MVLLGPAAGPSPTSLYHITGHPSTASTVLLSNGPLLCGFNVPIKGLSVVAMTVDINRRPTKLRLSHPISHNFD